MKKAQVILDKPIYTAFTVLEVTKIFMYDWHYNKVKEWYGNKANFLFTDTDSLAYHIKTKDLSYVCVVFLPYLYYNYKYRYIV